ncbi:MAG: UbiX family flavin prenyltransferase [Geminicoccaceae bacterium]|nr:UbiX family flavin prenyltransferase [Geminicoccaceae bacterium]
MSRRRIVVGISGASGVILGVRLLELLRELDIETHLVMSRAAMLTIGHELGRSIESVKALASVVHPPNDVGASIASGSFKTEGMIIAPCSMRTLAAIATGVTDTLLTRAADVVLKERRRLVLLPRETPLHLGHLRNMVAVTETGAVVMPPVPAFYTGTNTLEAVVDQILGRALDLFGLDCPTVVRWQGGRS